MEKDNTKIKIKRESPNSKMKRSPDKKHKLRVYRNLIDIF